MMYATLAAGMAVALTIPATLHAEGDASKQTGPLHHFEDQSPIEQTQATLQRMDHGTYATADTHGLAPAHAVTLWWVVFNDPGQCSGGECGEDDIFNLDAAGNFVLTDDGSPPMNEEMIEKAQISVLRGDGKIVPEHGKAEFRGHLPIGDTTEAMFGPGLIDPMKAEIHLVLRDHQVPPLELMMEALNSMHGACDVDWPNEPCTDIQFAVFKPAAEAM